MFLFTRILLCTSCQTRGFTHVWLPAPAVKRRGALSWKSKVQHEDVEHKKGFLTLFARG